VTASLWPSLASERLVLASYLSSLSPAQWAEPTLCPAWDVHGMAAHLCVPLEFSALEMTTSLVRARFSPDRLSVLMASRRARLSSSELVALLRSKAESRKAPPFIGVLGPYTDALVHGQDIALPLGVPLERPPAVWLPALDFLVSRLGRMGFVAAPVPAVLLSASDAAWSHGSGPLVTAPAAALALALLRRTPRLGELTGPGAGVLRSWATR
jgi:uncharacterized protein (TIGR03083 family)